MARHERTHHDQPIRAGFHRSPDAKDSHYRPRPASEVRMSTSFTVQCFQMKGRKLVADPPKSARSADAAIELAERLAVSKSGVVAFSQEIDIETDSYDEPHVLCLIGTLPDGLFAEQ